MTYRVYCAWCKNNNSGHNESKQNFKKIVDSAGKGEIKKRTTETLITQNSHSRLIANRNIKPFTDLIP